MSLFGSIGSGFASQLAPPVEGQVITQETHQWFAQQAARQEQQRRFMQQMATPAYSLGAQIFNVVKKLAIRSDEEDWPKGGTITCPHFYSTLPGEVYRVALLNWHVLLCGDCHRGLDAYRKGQDW